MESRGILAANDAHKCTNLAMFHEGEDFLQLELPPFQSHNILLRYMSFEPLPCTYLLKFTKLVDMYDLGMSFQIRVNQGKAGRDFVRSAAPQLKDQLPPDEIVTLMQDPSQPFLHKRLNEIFSENIAIIPKGEIRRDAAGKIISTSEDKLLQFKDQQLSFTVFEYTDRNQNKISKITLLNIEKVI